MKESLKSKVVKRISKNVNRPRVRPFSSQRFPVNEHYTPVSSSNMFEDSSVFHKVLSQTLDETTVSSDELDSDDYAPENYFPPQHCFNYLPEPV